MLNKLVWLHFGFSRSVIRPRRTCGAGFKTALEVLLYNPTDDYFASTFSSYGHQVHLLNYLSSVCY